MDTPTPTPSPTPEPAGTSPPTPESLQAEIDGLRGQLENDVACPIASPQRTALLAQRMDLLQQQAALEAAPKPEPTPPPDPAASLPFPLTPEAAKDPVTVERVRVFATAAAELGIAPAEMQSLLSHPPQGDADVTEAVLRQEWGKDYDANIAAASAAFARFPAEIQSYMEAKGYVADPYIISRLARLGKPMAEARPRYEQIVQQLAHPTTRLSEEQEAKLRAEYRRLGKILYGTDTAPGHVRQ